jgi:hypothetical protein
MVVCQGTVDGASVANPIPFIVIKELSGIDWDVVVVNALAVKVLTGVVPVEVVTVIAVPFDGTIWLGPGTRRLSFSIEG